MALVRILIECRLHAAGSVRAGYLAVLGLLSIAAVV